MRIAIFTETFLPKVDGVVTRLVRTLDQLTEMGHEALIFAPHNPPAEYRGHRVIKVPAISFRPWYPELFLGLPRPRLGRELDNFGPDVVHVINPVVLGLWGSTIAIQRDLPLLASFHTDLPNYVKHLNLSFLTPVSKSILRDIHNLAHVNLCTSTQMIQAAENIGIKRVRLWPKAIDTDAYHPSFSNKEMRHELSGGEPDKPLLVYVGRLSHEKRLDLLEPVIRQLPGVRLALVGSGPAEAHLRRQFQGTPTVFTGYMSGARLAAAYASADVFVFPSDTETLGFVAMEAMASGVPAVAARAGGIPDVIRHEDTGLLFEAGNPAAMLEQVKRLLADPAERAAMGQRARADMERWSWRASTEKLLEYYGLAGSVKKLFDTPGERSRPVTRLRRHRAAH